MSETDTGIWRVHNSDVRASDRGVIWKYAGGEAWAGVVALAEALTDPEETTATNDPYWREIERAAKVEPRVRLRTVRSPNLPLKLPHPALNGLSAATGSQRSIFTMTPEQWSGVVEAAGGWPDDLVDEAEQDSAEFGQGVARTARRLAVEAHAMKLAAAHFEDAGWHVDDVSAEESFDLRCTRRGSPEQHVEVKGTTTDGTLVRLTRNEVDHARSHPSVVLLVVSGIELEDTPEGLSATAGKINVWDPWAIDEGVLRPLQFEYLVPDKEP